MRASIKFRDEQKPLFLAKIPLNIIALPFQSGIVAGETKELSLNLATFFESGPQLKIAYCPNDSLNPFSVVFKTGICHFGSPISSSLNMSAEFNLTGGSQNSCFFVHFKPQFGDFTVKKTQSSMFKKQINSSVDAIDDEKEMATVMMKKSNKSTVGTSFQKLPVLLINKIGIEHVVRSDCVQLENMGRVNGLNFYTCPAASSKYLTCTNFYRQLMFQVKHDIQ